MIRPGVELSETYICTEAVDFRKQINGRAALVQDELSLDPFSEHLFVFTNRRKDRVKMLYRERNGFVLWMKRLERERFRWPRGESPTVRLSGQELNWLLDRFDLAQWRPHQRLDYQWVA